jgi:hypothetical protein
MMIESSGMTPTQGFMLQSHMINSSMTSGGYFWNARSGSATTQALILQTNTLMIEFVS